MANIKISQLPSIGNGLTASTILPVVNTTGTLTTDKVAVGNIANFTLLQAGNTLPPAFVANVAYNVTNAAQPNITSVGNLTGLTINSINNFHIPGGTNGYVLQTNGNGTLSWTAQTGNAGNGSPGGANSQLQFNLSGSFAGDADLTWDAANNQLNTVTLAATTANISGNINTANLNATGNLKPNAIYTDHYYYANGYVFGGGGGNGTPGGSNTQIQFNDGGVFGGNTGFTFNKTTGIFSSPFLAGNGNGLSNIQGANVSGAVASATIAGTANAVAGANVSGAVTYAGTANSVAVANVVGLGNIATVALNGNGSTFLRGNGTWGNATGDLGFTSNAMYGLNGVIVENADLTHGATSALILPINGNSAAPVQLTNTYGNIVVTTGIDSGSLKNWTFDNTGNLTLPANTFAVKYANGTQVSLGGGANTGNVTFANAVVQGVPGYGLGLAPTPDDTANLKYLQVRAGDVDSHIHFDTADGIVYDQYFGDDNKYLKLEKGLAGNVLIGTYQDGGIGQIHWTYDSNGNLILPENGRIKAAGNTVPFNTTITGMTSGSATVVVTTTDNIFTGEISGQVTISNVNAPSQSNGTWWYLAVETNQFQLYYDQALTSPVDGTSWPGYAGGGDAVSVGSAMTINASNITIDTGLGNSWTFDTNGDVSFPQGSASFTKGRIQSANGYPTLLGYGSLPFHGGPELNWMNGDNPNDMGNTSVLRNTLYINNNGLYVGMNENGVDVANNFSGSWRFASGGGLTIPAGDANNIVSGQIFSDNESSFINLDVQFDSNVLGGIRLGTSGPKPVDIVTGNGSGGYYTWRFDSNGEIATPDGTLFGAVEGSGTFGFYNANNTSFLIEGPNNVTWSFDTGTANTTIPGAIISTTGNLKLQPNNSVSGAYLDVYLTTGPDIHIASNSENLILGRDGLSTVNVNANNTVAIHTPNSSGIPSSLANWNGGGGWNQGSYIDLATTGGTGTGLTVDVAAGGGGYISINQISIHTPGTGYSNGDVITITNENNIPGTFTITVVDNEWVFDTSGELTFPRDTSVTTTDPILQINGGATPRISSVDASLAGPANLQIQSNYLNLSGYTGAKVVIYADDGEIGATGNIVLTANNNGSANTWTFAEDGNLTVAGNIIFNSNIYINNGFTLSTLSDIGGQVDYNNRTMGYVADNNGTASLYARDSAGLGNHNAVITANGASGTALIRTSNEALTDYDWTFSSAGNLTLPTISLGSGVDEQAVVSSQRKLIPPFRYSAVISGSTPTVVYTATDVNTTSMKVTMQIQHTGLGMEFFEVFATFTGADTYFTVGNRVSPPTIAPSTIVVGLGVGNAMKITVEINSGATTSWVTYDAVEFGIAVD